MKAKAEEFIRKRFPVVCKDPNPQLYIFDEVINLMIDYHTSQLKQSDYTPSEPLSIFPKIF